MIRESAKHRPRAPDQLQEASCGLLTQRVSIDLPVGRAPSDTPTTVYRVNRKSLSARSFLNAHPVAGTFLCHAVNVLPKRGAAAPARDLELVFPAHRFPALRTRHQTSVRPCQDSGLRKLLTGHPKPRSRPHAACSRNVLIPPRFRCRPGVHMFTTSVPRKAGCCYCLIFAHVPDFRHQSRMGTRKRSGTPLLLPSLALVQTATVPARSGIRTTEYRCCRNGWVLSPLELSSLLRSTSRQSSEQAF